MAGISRPRPSGRTDTLGRQIKLSDATVEARATAPAPAAGEGIERGMWVRTSRHGYTGRVTTVHARCPESKGWIDGQEIPVSDEDRAGKWVSILCHGGGSVVTPISTVAPLTDEERPARLNNLHANDEFKDLPDD